MTTLSINMPNALAEASQKAAGRMGISRSEFIRQAVAHELNQYLAKQEEEAMVRSMAAMKESKAYRKQAEEFIEGFNADLPEEKDEWWKK